MIKPPMYRPDPELAIVANQVAFLFHVLIGADPIGDFQAVDNISYGMQPFSYAEGGRNHSPRMFPFDGPAKAGELTLRWGMLIRTQLYDWMRAVKVGQGFRRDVTILQLDRQKIPVRLMRLRNAWPVSWQGANLASTETSFAVEQITLVYEDLNLVSNKARVVPLPVKIGGEELSPLDASDYQDEQERLDAMLEEADAARAEREAAAAALRDAQARAEADAAADKLKGDKAREKAKAAREAQAQAAREAWEQQQAEAAAAREGRAGAAEAAAEAAQQAQARVADEAAAGAKKRAEAEASAAAAAQAAKDAQARVEQDAAEGARKRAGAKEAAEAAAAEFRERWAEDSARSDDPSTDTPSDTPSDSPSESSDESTADTPTED